MIFSCNLIRLDIFKKLQKIEKLIKYIGIKKNYIGTSKRIKEEEVSRICIQILSAGYKLLSMSHDNDASTIS